jgi:hypothetical protein
MLGRAVGADKVPVADGRKSNHIGKLGVKQLPRSVDALLSNIYLSTLI